MNKYYDRKNKKYKEEKAPGEKLINWLYYSKPGMNILEKLVKKKFISSLYGFYCNTKLSKVKIKSFIDSYGIDMSVYKKSCENFSSFNDFFIRELKDKLNPYDKNTFISPASSKILAYENIKLDNLVQVKGSTFSFRQLLNNSTLNDKFKGGTCLVFRLSPKDYHRFHFVDNGICEKTVKIKGSYYSVNPAALSKIPELFCQNKREWSLFHSENFGDIVYVEVGATCVGSIIQTYSPGNEVSKGDEKGYFKFGGSTVILFIEKSRIKIDSDILQQSSSGIETAVLVGEKIGTKISI